MKALLIAAFLTIIMITSTPIHAEQVNYTNILKEWSQKLLPGENVSFIVTGVTTFNTEKNDQPKDSLAMYVTVTHNGQKDEYVVLTDPKRGVFAFKKMKPIADPNSQEEGESCSPEEHEQHHGKKST